MAKAVVFYNPLAGKCTEKEKLCTLEKTFKEPIVYYDLTKLKSHIDILNSLEKDDCVIICGGDGTLNRFVNSIEGINISNKIFYYPTGTGNDFAFDLGHTGGDSPFEITEYLKDLPCVEVNGEKYRFINGVGYGIDGYCCEVGDEEKKKTNKQVNYALIAVKGLLFHFRPKNATVTVDGISHTYNKVWLAPTMNGRFYGGGMTPTPEQKRIGENRRLSVMIFHDAGILKTVLLFPLIFTGKHTDKKKYVDIFEGNEISVEFDRPTALQFDGETIKNVTSYKATLITETCKEKNACQKEAVI